VELILSVLLIGGLMIAVPAAILILLRRRSDRADIEQARKLFHLRREALEARFMRLASQSGSPRGLEWTDCDFEDRVAFARDRKTGRLRALVAVTICFQAIEGGGMEDNPNVGNPRAATAIFYLDGDEWGTDGRTLFNLNPAEAIEYYHSELEQVE
jgi:hypothetical protein